MDFEIDESAIRKTVASRKDSYKIKENWQMPSGKPRTSPVYFTTIRNPYLDKTRDIKAQSELELHQKAREQIEKWKEQEIRAKISDAKQKATGDAETYWTEQSRAAKAAIEDVRSILAACLRSSPVLNLDTYFDQREFPAFSVPRPQPVVLPPIPTPPQPKRKFMQLLIPPLWQKALQQHAVTLKRHAANEQARQQKHEQDLTEWEAECDAAQHAHEEQRTTFLQTQSEHNEHIKYFIEQYEAGTPGAVKGYLEEVFATTKYPDNFPVEHEVSFDAESSTAVIDISLPCQDALSTVIDYKFKKTSRTGEPVEMKPKDHDELYDSAVKQSVLRTLHTAIAATRSDAVSGAVVNGWVTYLDKATGTDKTSCVISVSTDRQKLEEVNLERVDPTECIKSLKGLIAGPLSQVAPVQPIFQLNREDRRFVESQAVLAEINATTNLAEIGWEEFEHLVRELFNEMFSENGAEVKVTQASSDGGVDAIAFDPDPIRGGKFVIQAKRYTKVVPVSAVRDLYGTMIAEGASKGLLVTTAHYGRDSREFVKDKPISLIDGSNLVYLLEKYGHKVRIDVKAARSNMERNPLAR
jgi:restriction system protein